MPRPHRSRSAWTRSINGPEPGTPQDDRDHLISCSPAAEPGSGVSLELDGRDRAAARYVFRYQMPLVLGERPAMLQALRLTAGTQLVKEPGYASASRSRWYAR